MGESVGLCFFFFFNMDQKYVYNLVLIQVSSVVSFCLGVGLFVYHYKTQHRNILPVREIEITRK